MYISIDIGGTNTRVALSKNLKDIEAFETFPSQPDLKSQKVKIKQTVDALCQGKKVIAYAVGIAGFIDTKNCSIINSPNYKILNGTNVKELVSASEDVPVLCLNDTKIAGLGESILGSGKNCNVVAYLALGTGVGGSLVVNQKLDDRSYEPGHQIIKFDDILADGLEIYGSYEAYASGTAFFKNYGVRPRDCKDAKIWHEYGKKVGIGLQNVIFMWNPDCIVIGGGMAKHFDEFLPGIESHLNRLDFINLPRIFKAEFTEGSGIVGGFVYLSQQGYKAI
jgi:glucokinase